MLKNILVLLGLHVPVNKLSEEQERVGTKLLKVEQAAKLKTDKLKADLWDTASDVLQRTVEKAEAADEVIRAVLERKEELKDYADNAKDVLSNIYK